MLWVCVEGADRSGKTTLFEALSRSALNPVACVGRYRTPRELLPVMHHFEAAWLGLCDQLAARGRVLFDRSPTLTPEVYSRVLRRPLLIDPRPYLERQLIVYVETPQEEMVRRFHQNPKALSPEDYGEVLAAYEDRLQRYPHVLRVSGVLNPSVAALEVLSRVAAIDG